MRKNSRDDATTAGATTTIPYSLRYVTNICSMLSVFCFSGIIFGWAPLELLLFQEGQYSSLCSGHNNVDGNGSYDTDGGSAGEDLALMANDDGGGGHSTTSCSIQRNKLNFIFTMAQFTLSFASLPVGFILDYISKPYYYMLTATIEIVGLILFGISDATTTSSPPRDYFLFGYCCMALGGCMTMLGAFPSSFLLPNYQAAILASISCLFDASSVVFFVFLKLFSSNNGNNGGPSFFFTPSTRKQMFIGWSFVAVALYTSLGFCWYYLEKHDWKDVLHQEKERERENEGGSGGIEEEKHYLDDDDSSYDVSGNSKKESISNYMLRRIETLHIHEWSLTRQLLTPDFALTITFISIHMLRANYYIMTVDNYLLSIGDFDATYANMFSWILPCGIVFVPIIERTFTLLGVINTLHIADLLGIIFGIVLLIPSLQLQVINFIIFTCFRAYLYATLNTIIAITFGVKTMGRIIGCTFTTAAIVSLVQYPIGVLSEVKYEGNFTPMNILMLALCIIPITMAFCFVYCWIKLNIDSEAARSSCSSNNSIGYGSIPTQEQRKRQGDEEVDEEDLHSSLLLGSPGSSGVLKQIRESRRRQRQFDDEYFDEPIGI